MSARAQSAAVQPGKLRQLWWRWKMLKLPWRKQWLIGSDLAGNTFWEFRDQLNAGRVRRIVKYANSRVHYADVKMSPSWIQWLRQTRQEPPSIGEQQLDEIRQAQMRELASQADTRWAAKPSVLDPPSMKSRAQTGSQVKDPGGYAAKTEPLEKQGVRNYAGTEGEVQASVDGDAEHLDQGRFRGQSKEKVVRGEGLAGPGQRKERQPEGWKPSIARRR